VAHVAIQRALALDDEGRILVLFANGKTGVLEPLRR
jgi:hypothetical protein